MNSVVNPQDIIEHRWVGVAMLLIGAAFAYFGIVGPFQQAAQHVATISIEDKAVGASIICFIYGTMCLLNPRFVVVHMGGYRSRSPQTARGWTFLAFAVGAAILFSIWFDRYFASAGYARHF